MGFWRDRADTWILSRERNRQARIEGKIARLKGKQRVIVLPTRKLEDNGQEKG